MAEIARVPHSVTERACLDFCNSQFTDHLGSGEVYDRAAYPEWWIWFLDRWQLGPMPAERIPIERLKSARAALRACLEAAGRPDWVLIERLNGLMALAPSVRRLGPNLEITVEPRRHDWLWLITALANSAAEVIASGDWRRVKVCANPACSFLFFDESQNRSRRWCDPAICGNLVKVRRFRSRAGTRPGSA